MKPALALVLIATLAAEPEAKSAAPGRGRGWIVSTAIAGVSLVTGSVLMGLARLDEAQLRSGNGIVTYADVVRVRGRGETLQFTGVALLAVASAAAIGALILWGFQRTDVQPNVALLPGGGWAGVTFTLR